MLNSQCYAAALRPNVTVDQQLRWNPSMAPRHRVIISCSFKLNCVPQSTTQHMAIMPNQLFRKDTGYVKVNVTVEPLADAGPDKVVMVVR